MVAQPIIYEDFYRSARRAFFSPIWATKPRRAATGTPVARRLRQLWAARCRMSLNYTDRRRSAANDVAVCCKISTLLASALQGAGYATSVETVGENPSGNAGRERRTGDSYLARHSVRRAARGPAALARAAASRPLAGVRPAETFSAASWQDIDYCRELGGGDLAPSAKTAYISTSGPRPAQRSRCR